MIAGAIFAYVVGAVLMIMILAHVHDQKETVEYFNIGTVFGWILFWPVVFCCAVVIVIVSGFRSIAGWFLKNLKS